MSNQIEDQMDLDQLEDQKVNCANANQNKPFVLKKWSAVATWSWNISTDTCAICRVIVMDACLKCQAENKPDDCVVVYGDCSHVFHNCCMSLWVKQNARCPLCQCPWSVSRTCT